MNVGFGIRNNYSCEVCYVHMGGESISKQLSRLVQLNMVLRHAWSARIPRWMKAIIKFLHVADGIIFLSGRILDFVVVVVSLFSFHLLHFSNYFFLRLFC